MYLVVARGSEDGEMSPARTGSLFSPQFRFPNSAAVTAGCEGALVVPPADPSPSVVPLIDDPEDELSVREESSVSGGDDEELDEVFVSSPADSTPQIQVSIL